MKITIIGGGHIGGATAKGLVKAGAAEVTVTARTHATLDKFKGTSVRTTTDNAAAVKEADFIVISVKTAQVPGVAAEIREALAPGQTVVCMAAQVTPEQMQEMLRRSDGFVPGLAYVIPNTAIELLESVTFISDVSAGEQAVATLRDVFGKAGVCLVVERSLLPAGIALASCGIGYAFKYICSAIEGGRAIGLSDYDVTSAVCQTVKGAATLLMENGSDPVEELRHVATPGGLTERGVKAMDANGFTNAVIEGLKASM